MACIARQRAGLLTQSGECLAEYVKGHGVLEGISLGLIVKATGEVEKMGKKELPRRCQRNAE